ncbi:MAG: DUF4867 family protein [Spirochaetes bacterium]|nr:DUF4867 family protein [Spirochaetota bacterium]
MNSKTFIKFQQENPDYTIHPVSSDQFLSYGRTINNIDISPFQRKIDYKETPGEGVEYIADIAALSSLPLAKELAVTCFGEMEIQVGWCRGFNRLLGALEYHKSSEVIVSLTDCILILGKTQQISNNQYHTMNTEIFFVPQNTLLELYSGTLHFAPIAVHKTGFITLIILPKKTNLPLNKSIEQNATENKNETQLLFMKNKWLLAFTGSKQEKKGAYPGLLGDNIGLNQI